MLERSPTVLGRCLGVGDIDHMPRQRVSADRRYMYDYDCNLNELHLFAGAKLAVTVLCK